MFCKIIKRLLYFARKAIVDNIEMTIGSIKSSSLALIGIDKPLGLRKERIWINDRFVLRIFSFAAANRSPESFNMEPG